MSIKNFDYENYNSANQLLYVLDHNNNVADTLHDPGVNLQAFLED